MEKIKTQKIICFSLIAILVIAVQTPLYGQNYLSKERENEIKTLEKYYWAECSTFKENEAKECALVYLSNRVIEDAVNQSEKQDKVLKAIAMGAHLDRLQQQGKVKILAWIAKDSVFITAPKPITQTPVPKPAPVVQSEVKEETPPAEKPVPQPELASQPEVKTIVTDDSVMQELAACKTFKEVKRVSTIKGLVRGSKINSSEGFSNPEKCIIAVFFTADGTLSALLDVGSNSRTDLLSGKTIQNLEQYSKEEYFLWYLQQKNN